MTTHAMAASAVVANRTADETYIVQQTTKVTGRVVDATGEPIVGASVVERGNKTNGVTTDADGRFTLNVHSAKAELIVSFIGYNTTTVAVKDGYAEVVLAESDTDLEEVVVVAFGKQKREAFTGSAGVVKADVITERQVENPIAALNGQVAGVQMVEGNGPGSDPSIIIRGVSSINASSKPLIVLDGSTFSGSMSDINPADIESITVQKDAASNALYGARGANGVIFVTTKNAKRGRATISFDARWGSNVDAKIDYDKITDPGQYYQTHYTALYNYFRNSQGYDAYAAWQEANARLSASSSNGGVGIVSMGVPEGEYLIGQNGLLNPHAHLGNIVSHNGHDYLLTPDDWRREGLRNGLRQEYNLNINGGNDDFQSYVSLGYLKNEGVSFNNYSERYSGRMKLDYQARPWLKVGTTGSFSHQNYDGQNNMFSVVHDIAPIYPVYIRDAQGNILTDSHGKMYDYGDGLVTGVPRPVYVSQNAAQDDMGSVYRSSSNKWGLLGYADFILPYDFKVTVNASFYDAEQRDNIAPYPYYGFYAQTGGYSQVGHDRQTDFNTQQLLNWGHQYGEHNVSALLGHEYYFSGYNYLSGTKDQFYDFDTNIELDGLLSTNSTTSYTTHYNVEGYFLRAMYDYASRYYLSGSYRRDGSSRFSRENGRRWGNFWSVGGAWIISKEKFMADTADWLNMLKLKISYGSQGNDGIGDYLYTDTYNYASTSGKPAYTFAGLGNKDITWETNGNFNVGLEFDLFQSRLSGGVEYYRRKTTDMLLQVKLPWSSGVTGYYDNVGDMLNEGFEFNLSASLIRTAHVNWTVDFNLSHNRNEVVYLNDDNKGTVIDGHAGYKSGTKFISEGLPLYTWYIKRYAGADANNGQALWYVKGDDGQLTTTNSWDAASYFLCGDANPRMYGGFGTNFSAYGFDLSVNCLYSLGGKVYDYGYADLMCNPYGGWTGTAYHKDVLRCWTPENTTTDIPRWQYADADYSAISDRFLTSANSLTLKNISLGYTLPQNVVRRLQLTKLRFYASADNIFYWTARRGLDPRNSFGGEASATGYSPIRTISGGVSINF